MTYLDTSPEAFCLMEGHIWHGGGSCVRCSEKLRCGCGQFVTEAGLDKHLQTCPQVAVALEPPASDPRPDPRTHPEFWTE